jgi:hypothetical protein
MNSAEARQLVLDEALRPDGVVVGVRMGDDPGAARMENLLAALRVLCEDHKGRDAVERRLAYALHGIAVYLQRNVESWAHAGRTWRPQLVEREVPAIMMGVESVFAGEWAELTG